MLLVEDEDGVRSLAHHILTTCGYQVLQAAHGAQALSLATQHTGPIDVLITDVVMPNMGGREVADHIQKLYPDVRILYISGYTDDAIVRHGVLTERANFLQKPFTPMLLSLKVREVLDSPA